MLGVAAGVLPRLCYPFSQSISGALRYKIEPLLGFSVTNVSSGGISMRPLGERERKIMVLGHR